jgi:transposase-like protein
MGGNKYSKELNARISIDAIEAQKTIAVLATEYGVHTNHISIWKKQLLDAAPVIFSIGKDHGVQISRTVKDAAWITSS